MEAHPTSVCSTSTAGAAGDPSAVIGSSSIYISREQHVLTNSVFLSISWFSVFGWTDMLTLMAMRWNQLKLDNLATSLTRRYQKATKALQTQLQNLESLRIEFSVCDSQLGDWVSNVKEWAEVLPV
ncbi:hypothetical protein AMECASPLE_039637 [Ameca splendens]|uniref:Biogenesis of lysosome-related organelles complex 1 subunit 1 n=1 Tax=Ameca splendens TaxID=208324 RepID=A0ABV1A607_9TELE